MAMMFLEGRLLQALESLFHDFIVRSFSKFLFSECTHFCERFVFRNGLEIVWHISDTPSTRSIEVHRVSLHKGL